MKIKAEHLWPLILHFVEEYFGEDDLTAFKSYFKLKVEHGSDPLVQAGGIKAILNDYFKQNKPVYKKFKKIVESGSDAAPALRKRTRAQSNASEVSESQPKKRQRTSSVASEQS